MAVDLSTVGNVLMELPALSPPPGVTPNFDNPPSKLGMALAIIVPCMTITTAVTFLRIYTKTFISRKWMVEDYLLPVAWLFSMSQFIPALVVISFAPVLHQWDMTIKDVSRFLLNFHVGRIFYDATLLVLKMCILAQFVRIFVSRGEKGVTFWVTHILIAVNSVFYLTCLFIEIWACRPMRRQWDPLVKDGHCVNSAISYLVGQCFNLALDLLILLWTQAIIWRLEMSTKQKVKLGVLFVAGFIACIFSATSVWINVQIQRTKDQAYWAAWMGLFTFPETTAGFLILCLPVLPKFVKHLQIEYFPGTINSIGTPSEHDGWSDDEDGRGSGEASRAIKGWWESSGAKTGAKRLSGVVSRWSGTTVGHEGTPRTSRNLSSSPRASRTLQAMQQQPRKLSIKPEETEEEMAAQAAEEAMEQPMPPPPVFMSHGPPELDMTFDFEDSNGVRVQSYYQSHGNVRTHEEVDTILSVMGNRQPESAEDISRAPLRTRDFA